MSKRPKPPSVVDAPGPLTSPSLQSFPRAGSPSGLGSFLKPSKWFSRSTSTSSLRIPEPDPKSRPSFSASRRPVISQPTDPRPILEVPANTTHSPLGVGSKSVLDLSLPRSSGPENHNPPNNERSWPSSSEDLAATSRKTWSRSVDDLSKFSLPSHQANNDAPKSKNYNKSNSSTRPDTARPARPEQTRQPKSFPTIITTTPDSSPTPVSVLTRKRSLSHSNAPLSSSPSRQRDVPAVPPIRTPSPSDKVSFGGIGGFPFHFGASQPSSKSLAPIDSPTQRSSQVVHQSGFMNRRPFPTSTDGLTLARGWKPSKVVLKGTKLLFYKPPAERVQQIKDLFPTGIVGLPDITELSQSGSGELVSSPPTGEVSRKRVYWGRERHPDLVISQDGTIVERGSSEGLVHEATFGTLFFPSNLEGTEIQQSPSDREAAWREFVSTVLLCLPHHTFMGRPKFESELRRCIGYLVRGASDAEVAPLTTRAEWICGRYLETWGEPLDHETWRPWAEEIFGEASPLAARSTSKAGPSRPPYVSRNTDRSSTSIQKTPTPRRASKGIQPIPPVSPARGAQDKERHKSSKARSAQTRLWAQLEKEGFTRELFGRLEVDRVATSLGIWHRNELRALPQPMLSGNLLDAASTVVEVRVAAKNTAGAATRTGSIGGNAELVSSSGGIEIFCGSDARPNWLTRLIVTQILGPGFSGNTVAEDNTADARSLSQLSRTHARAVIITRWVKVGEQARVTGDECTWMAVKSAICCQAIARLDKVWRRVDSAERKLVEGWAVGNFAPQSSSYGVPWTGDLIEEVGKGLAVASDLKDKDNEWVLEPMSAIERLVTEDVKLWEERSPEKHMLDDVKETDGEVAALIKFWGYLSAIPAPPNSAIGQNLSLSFAAEPRQKGYFAPYFWKPPAAAPSHPLLPLLFPEPLPVHSFLDRKAILRGQTDTDRPHTDSLMGGVSEAQFHRTTRSWLPHARDARHGGDRRIASRSSHDHEIGDTFMYAFDGELVLKVVPSDIPSKAAPQPQQPKSPRPVSSIAPASMSASALSTSLATSGTTLERRPSLAPSVRAATASQLERKTSAMRSRRSSLPSMSNRPSLIIPEPASESTLRVAVSGGTLDRLVDVLISGLEVAVAATDDSGISTGRTRVFSVDQLDFDRSWWCTYRSFVSPFVFFELLRKRYIQSSRSQSATAANSPIIQRMSLPSVGLPTTEEDELTPPQLATISSDPLPLAILRVMQDWVVVGGGAQDVLDDAELYQAFKAFLKRAPSRLSTEKFGQLSDVDVARRQLSQIFNAQIQRPDLIKDRPPSIRTSGPEGFGADPPSMDEIGAPQLVESLDAIAQSVWNSVTRDDLIIAADILEVQTADQTGWYLSREVPTTPEEVAGHNIYSVIHHIEPSPLISELNPHDSLQKSLPPTLRMVFRAHAIIRKWVTAQLSTTGIGLRVRQQRMDLILRAIETCRLRSLTVEEGQEKVNIPSVLQSCVRSFVETALVSALWSPESRTYARAWHGVGSDRGVSIDSLSSIFSNPVVNQATFATSSPPTLDVGWLLERFLEIISLPDTFNSTAGGHILVNFDKRRYITGLVESADASAAKQPQSDRYALDRMNNMLRDVFKAPNDVRILRDDAFRESAQPLSQLSANKRPPRPFQHLVSAEIEKIRRDRQVRDRLSKEKKLEQLRTERRENDLNRAMHQPKKSSISTKHERSKRSMSVFFRVVRPISTAFSSERMHTPNEPRKRTASELDFVPGSKPSLVLNLVDARVTPFINDERSFIFQLDTDDGGHWLLQALSAADLKTWMGAISKTARLSAQKRLTYSGNGMKPQFSDLVDVSTELGSNNPNAIFGISITTLVKRENRDWDDSPTGVPLVLEQCLQEVEKRGLTEVGIYRISGATSAINAIRTIYNEGSTPDFDNDPRFGDIHGVCGAIKLWFRQLSEPVIPFDMYQDAISSSRIDDYEERFSKIRDIVHAMPREHFLCLRRLMEHLDKVTDYEEQNQMTSEALAICFSPSLLQPRPGPASFALGIGNMSQAMSFTKSLILQFHRIFDDLDPEPELDAPGDGDDVQYDDSRIEEGDEETVDAERSDRAQSPTPEDANPKSTTLL